MNFWSFFRFFLDTFCCLWKKGFNIHTHSRNSLEVFIEIIFIFIRYASPNWRQTVRSVHLWTSCFLLPKPKPKQTNEVWRSLPYMSKTSRYRHNFNLIAIAYLLCNGCNLWKNRAYCWRQNFFLLEANLSNFQHL